MSSFELTVNGTLVEVVADPVARLSDVLRDHIGLKGTKIGCNAGDCGACTVLLDGHQVCACLTPVSQAAGRSVTTVEGMAGHPRLAALQRSFLHHGAAQCGICTPGMLMAASELVLATPHGHRPREEDVLDTLGGVLCRCTGYRKIIDAVLNVDDAPSREEEPVAGASVGARMVRVDGLSKVEGREVFGADQYPPDTLFLRAVRSPHHHARFKFGAMASFLEQHNSLVRIITAADIPGHNSFGIFPKYRDQPVLADGYVRYRGEAVALLVGDLDALATIPDQDVPIAWDPLPAVSGIDAAQSRAAPQLHDRSPGNILVNGRFVSGDADLALNGSDIVAEGEFETSFVEHAYIEPEAGFARRVGDRMEIFVSTQAPYMNRAEVAWVLGIDPEQVRIIPSSVGGGFGGKIDMAVQPLIAVAAWLLNRPVRAVFSRPESMAATTKRHPARITAKLGCNKDGRLTGFKFHADFNTGPYASCGPIVANRVPLHAMGPYSVPVVACTTKAIYTNDSIAGAFRGFGVPQAAIAHEALMDELADKVGMDRLEFRLLNALQPGARTLTDQPLPRNGGLVPCLKALRPKWQDIRERLARAERRDPKVRRGVGIGCMWYGIGNTSEQNPSSMEVALASDGSIVLYSGAVDIGQGASTILTQICADALGVPAGRIRLVCGDTDLTLDAGKSSASRQTFISGNAVQRASLELRRKLLRLGNASEDARIVLDGGCLHLIDGEVCRTVDVTTLPIVKGNDVAVGQARYDPPTTDIDAAGRGSPYASYAFAAQIAEVEVDIALGVIKVVRIVAAHDVGRAVNPTQVEGQIHGGIAQGLGMALMEEYIPGRTENLHDYLIPTVGDVPPIETILIEEPDPLGPFGAKGVGEPALVSTPAAILGAFQDATGVRLTTVPATPSRVRAALRRQGFPDRSPA